MSVSESQMTKNSKSKKFDSVILESSKIIIIFVTCFVHVHQHGSAAQAVYYDKKFMSDVYDHRQGQCHA